MWTPTILRGFTFTLKAMPHFHCLLSLLPSRPFIFSSLTLVPPSGVTFSRKLLVIPGSLVMCRDIGPYTSILTTPSKGFLVPGICKAYGRQALSNCFSDGGWMGGWMDGYDRE
jgi:hypothetical protein